MDVHSLVANVTAAVTGSNATTAAPTEAASTYGIGQAVSNLTSEHVDPVTEYWE